VLRCLVLWTKMAYSGQTRSHLPRRHARSAYGCRAKLGGDLELGGRSDRSARRVAARISVDVLLASVNFEKRAGYFSARAKVYSLVIVRRTRHPWGNTDRTQLRGSPPFFVDLLLQICALHLLEDPTHAPQLIVPRIHKWTHHAFCIDPFLQRPLLVIT